MSFIITGLTILILCSVANISTANIPLASVAVGITGIAAFKVNERISLYAYGNKSLMPKRSPYYYPMPNFAPDRIGGMINFKFNESSSISIGVEGIKYPQGAYW